jgi:predicted metal-dependent hydrolase
MSSELLTVRDLEFEVRRSGRRKTVEVVVDRAGELRILAPAGLDAEVIEGFVAEKVFWIYTKLAEKEKLRPPREPKRHVSGEGFHYLGRSYRLLLVEEQDRPVKMVSGRLRLRQRDQAEGARHLTRWYSRRAQPWLESRVPRFTTRMGVTPVSVSVRDLGHRWGSCTPDGAVNFHWATIQLPPGVIVYVIVHELAHLSEPLHTPAFWRRVERAMPDYPERREWLAEKGAEYVGA